VLYRILHANHPRTGTKWSIYPSYDFAHGQSDAIEGVTHSICTLEFEDHRPLYDWFLDKLPVPAHPHQYEFARLNLTYTVLSKRVLTQLVRDGHVKGWDDPRLPTLRGIRRRGYTPEALRSFCERIGISKFNGTIDMAWLEDALRADLNKKANRVLAVLRPLKVVIENYPEGQVEELDAVNNPEDPSAGSRRLPFSRELYIERSDFEETPPKGFFRLSPGKEVRLRWAFFIKCERVVKDENGNVIELRCTYDPATRGGNAPDGRKVKGTIHWVSAAHALECEVRLYDHLFRVPNPDDVPEGASYLDNLNPASLEVLTARVEPSVAGAAVDAKHQFERLGYFCVDKDSTPKKLVFNRTVTLADTWAKMQKKGT
jgi:glutaminyl-tRNA synthetase